MRFLISPKTQAVAGTAALEIKKPIRGKLIIRWISAYSKYDIDFGRWRGYLFDPHTSTHRIELYQKWLPNKNVPLFTGVVEWPDGWRLQVSTVTQTANERLTYTIGYEIVEPEKKGWGQ